MRAGLLIAESDDGSYEPVSPVSTVSEAREIAASDFRRRIKETEGGTDVLCPARYIVWARVSYGSYATIAEIEPA